MTEPEHHIKQRLLPYCHRLDRRSTDSLRLVVVHCTELPDLATAREYGEKIHYGASGTGNSGHFYIERSGQIEQWVSEDRIAHHVRGFNQNSIGIELVNRGRYPDWFDSGNQEMQEAYAGSQIESLVWLLNQLGQRFPGIKSIAGHDQLDRTRVPASDRPETEVFRKQDPGPLFPWQQVLDLSGLERYTLKD